MELDEADQELAPAFVLARSWQVTLFLGVVTLILGLIVSFHPSGSLNVIAVLIGLLLILSGIFHLVRVFGPGESHRVWLGISGLLLVVIGVVLIRHLHLTVAIIGLVVGISWIVEGLSAIAAGFAGRSGEGRGWWIAFGFISLIAGIVVTAVPVNSVTALAVLVGIWFVVLGLCEIVAAFILRHAINKSKAAVVNPPRAGEGATALLSKERWDMAIGPVQLIVLGFNHPDFHGEVIAELERLRESDMVRVIDALAVYKDAEGTLEVEHLSNLTKDEAIELGTKIGALIGLGIEGEEGAIAGAEAGAELAEEEGIHPLGDVDEWDVLEDIPNDSAAALVLLEHHWAVPLRDAIARAGGFRISDGFISPLDLVGIGLMTAEEATELHAMETAGAAKP